MARRAPVSRRFTHPRAALHHNGNPVFGRCAQHRDIRIRNLLGIPMRRFPVRHNRFVRFGNWTCRIDLGLEIFERRKVARTSPCHFGARSEDDRVQENDLRKECTLVEIYPEKV